MSAELNSLTSMSSRVWPRPAWVGELPSLIQSLLEGVYDLVDKGQSPLAMAGLRMLLEQVLRDGVGANGSLRGRLDELHTRGVISVRDHARLMGVILHGNAAVHECVPVGSDVLRHLLMCVEHLLQGYFVLHLPALEVPSTRSREGG